MVWSARLTTPYELQRVEGKTCRFCQLAHGGQMRDDGSMLNLMEEIRRPTGKQLQAAQLAGAGMNDTEIARETGVTRQTIHKWRMKSAPFNQAMIEVQRGLYLEQHDRLTRLVNEALNVLETNMQSSDARVRNQAAGLVLRCAGAETRGWKWAWNVRDRVGRKGMF